MFKSALHLLGYSRWRVCYEVSVYVGLASTSHFCILQVNIKTCNKYQCGPAAYMLLTSMHNSDKWEAINPASHVWQLQEILLQVSMQLPGCKPRCHLGVEGQQHVPLGLLRLREHPTRGLVWLSVNEKTSKVRVMTPQMTPLAGTAETHTYMRTVIHQVLILPLTVSESFSHLGCRCILINVPNCAGSSS